MMEVHKTPSIVRFYKHPAFTTAKTQQLLTSLRAKNPKVLDVNTELCYHVEISTGKLTAQQIELLEWTLRSPHRPLNLSSSSHLKSTEGVTIEVGPRFNFSTAHSTNAISIFHSLGLMQITRLEVSRRYLVLCRSDDKLEQCEEDAIAALLHDRMTECRYTDENIPKSSFNERLVRRENLYEIDVMIRGRDALQEWSEELGSGFDDADLDYYTNLFKNILGRNPTNVECFDLAQSNSEHSRHWFFKGKMVIDGIEYEKSLIDMIIDTQKYSSQNNVIKFSDNSSAIKGYTHKILKPINAGFVSEFRVVNTESHLIFTAETHNFPTGVAPFSGATTGTGGRIRDVQAVGRGGHCIAGTAGYSVGNLQIPGYTLSWEDPTFKYPDNFATPLHILIEASNGASDYGNKFGEPVISGFVRTFGMVDNNGERREWIKPIMFSGGIGFMNANMVQKQKPEIGHEIVKIGGPVYRIGVGGGSASSIQVQGDNKEELDFNAVQRGDAEMENKLNRVVRACIELEERNPIVSIHDQGAGGNGNVLKELVEPVGGIIYGDKFELGDPTINALELWGAEYQENNALLCSKDNVDTLKGICKRERCPVNFVGEVTGSGRVVLTMDEKQEVVPFNLDLELVLGKMPRKVFRSDRKRVTVKELELPATLSIYKSLEHVLRLPSVCSKRYLTNKVDRCVTGLVAQQQCVGPLHTPLADVAVTAISHLGYEGIASSIGEQPIKGLINSAAGARLTVAEALSNLVFAGITTLEDVKCSGNWMWPAKLPGEGAALYDTCVAMTEVMSKLGIAIDGGKDSLSMAARVGSETVKSPGALVISTYAPCPDVRKVVTPDFKAPSMGKIGVLLYVDLSDEHNRLGGSALAQCFKQLGHDVPDLNNVEDFKNAFAATQELIKDGAVLAGHDVSDGGLITCLVEMCFGGMCGMEINIEHKCGSALSILFSEEVGWVLEVLENDVKHCLSVFKKHKAPIFKIGNSSGYGLRSKIAVAVSNSSLETTVLPLLKMWEETSYQLELRQTIKDCADSEYNSYNYRTGPKYKLTFDPDDQTVARPVQVCTVEVAVIREEGTNGDREMAAALFRVGFKVWDVTMQDLLNGDVTLDRFRGIIFPGGFSYADVLGSAKGWAASIMFNKRTREQFSAFVSRSDTFSLGVCNGCQLLALIGWVGSSKIPNESADIYLEQNISERYECRWSSVKVEKSRSIMLKGMEGSILGVWVAHGEGRFTFKDDSIYNKLEEQNCICLRYVDDSGNPTGVYPMNPNGSFNGLAGVCSFDGRHLAMMPHPERSVQPFQSPYIPPEWTRYEKSPWEKMFRNAYEWCRN